MRRVLFMVLFLIRQAKVWSCSKWGSPTLLLDRGPSMGAYVDYTLGNLVSEELEGSGVKVELENKPAFEGILPYAVKYRETSWQFSMAAEEALSLQSGKDTGIKAKGAATVEATKDLTLNGQNFTAEGKQNAEVKGGVQTSISGTMTSVQGGGGKVEVM